MKNIANDARFTAAPAGFGKAKDLKDLKGLAEQLAHQQTQAAQRARAAELARQQREAEKHLFARAAGAVQPLPDARRALLKADQQAPLPVQQRRDDAAVLRESISDGFDASTLLETDEALSYRRSGIGPDVARKLRRGAWSIQREIDLHGLRIEEAREALGQFIREAHKSGMRCVRVVHGKGLGSPGKTPVLKGKVHSWLIQKNEVLAFVQARASEGGAGALVVLLATG